MSLYPPLVAAPDEKYPVHPLPLATVQSLLRQAGWKSHVLHPATADATALRFVAENGQLQQEVARLNQENLVLRMEVQRVREKEPISVAEALVAVQRDAIEPSRAALRGVARFETVTGTCWCDEGEAGVNDPTFKHCAECLAARAVLGI